MKLITNKSVRRVSATNIKLSNPIKTEQQSGTMTGVNQDMKISGGPWYSGNKSIKRLKFWGFHDMWIKVSRFEGVHELVNRWINESGFEGVHIKHIGESKYQDLRGYMN